MLFERLVLLYTIASNSLPIPHKSSYDRVPFLAPPMSITGSEPRTCGFKSSKLTCLTVNQWLIFRVANFQTLVWDLRLFVILQTFLLLFHIYLKPRLSCTTHHKTTSKHPSTQEFWLYFAKKILRPQTKTGKAPPPIWLLPCLGRSMACSNANIKH